MQLRNFLSVLLYVVMSTARADSWPAPEIAAHASPQGLHVVRVLPGSDKGAVFGFAGMPRGQPATAVVYRLNVIGDYKRKLTFRLLNPVAPLFAAISDSGELVTLDNWHNMGIGNSVMVLYSSDGKVMRSLGLLDLYQPTELSKLRQTTSSIWWRCGAPPQFDARASTLEVMDALGNTLEISLKTGDVKRRQSSQTGC